MFRPIPALSRADTANCPVWGRSPLEKHTRWRDARNRGVMEPQTPGGPTSLIGEHRAATSIRKERSV